MLFIWLHVRGLSCPSFGKFYCSYIRLQADMYTLIGSNKICIYLLTDRVTKAISDKQHILAHAELVTETGNIMK